ncbi:MAG: glycosyltransferase [Prevotella sp.]|nr:glycosyltransferase [Prevotella sp.]
MKLSIITINYNNLEGLKETMGSVLSQNFKDYEWIVIDGGSTDGSKELLERNNDAISYWVSEPDRGIYHAMNKGVDVAQGEYCQFLNSGDSLISPDILEKVFSYELSDVNYGDVWLTKKGKVVEKRTYPDTITLPCLFGYPPPSHQATFFRTLLVKQHLYREQYSIAADVCLFLELYVTGSHFKHLPLPIVYFDLGGIGSKPETYQERIRQLTAIKQEFLPAQVVDGIEQLIIDYKNFQFVLKIAPLRWTYTFFRKVQILYGHFVSLILVGKW